jgi:hypothetical protein
MMCKHRNMHESCKKQINVNEYIVHLLDKYNEIYKLQGTY